MKLTLRAKVLFELMNYFSAFDVLKNKLLQLKNEHFKETLRLDDLPDLLSPDEEQPVVLDDDEIASMSAEFSPHRPVLSQLIETKFKIDIATPSIIIPRSSSSHSVLQCNLGHIKIESSFSHIEQDPVEVCGF